MLSGSDEGHAKLFSLLGEKITGHAPNAVAKQTPWELIKR